MQEPPLERTWMRSNGFDVCSALLRLRSSVRMLSRESNTASTVRRPMRSTLTAAMLALRRRMAELGKRDWWQRTYLVSGPSCAPIHPIMRTSFGLAVAGIELWAASLSLLVFG